jgi:hypothetical protein
MSARSRTSRNSHCRQATHNCLAFQSAFGGELQSGPAQKSNPDPPASTKQQSSGEGANTLPSTPPCILGFHKPGWTGGLAGTLGGHQAGSLATQPERKHGVPISSW